MTAKPTRLRFKGASGADLSARLDMPAGRVEGFALFAHCFTCSKDLIASRTVATALTNAGIAVLRFDFTGLGSSEGDFASTNFSMNLEDLVCAADYLREQYQAPSLLVGHSLGGAAVIAAARLVPEVKAVATINAPSDVTHVAGQFGDRLATIKESGEAEVMLGERPFTIKKQFLDDLEKHSVLDEAREMDAALLVLHAPKDELVGIEHASKLFGAAHHPKSFVSLDTADHLLSKPEDAAYAAEVIAAWAGRYIGTKDGLKTPAQHGADVVVRETGQGKFQNLVSTGPHHLIADEPVKVGGLGSGPSPYDLLAAALGACTTMTIRMYAERKGLELDRVTCRVHHEKHHADSMSETVDKDDFKPDHFTRIIKLEGELSEAARTRIMEIANKCPVHKTLETGAHIITERDEE